MTVGKDKLTTKALAKRPLWLPREMIYRGYHGAQQLVEHLPNEAYTQEMVFVLFHGNANAAYAVMDRIKGQEKNFSPALRRTIDRWLEFAADDFKQTVKAERDAATHNFSLPEVTYFVAKGYRDDGSYGDVNSHYFKQKQFRDMTINVFFPEWMLDLWTWWVGRINQLHRMYMAELQRSGDKK